MSDRSIDPQTRTSRRALLRTGGIGVGVVAATALSATAASAGSGTQWVNVKDHGAAGDGVTDDLSAVQAAIDAVDGQGGGVVFFPAGQYRLTDELRIGDGSDSAVSSKHHRITLLGSGRGGSPSLNFVQNEGATELIYDGPTDPHAAALSLEGPLHSLAVSHMVVSANAKAGYGVRVNHVTDSMFTNVMTRGATKSGWILTSRNGFPPGCVYGCGNNVLLHCWAYDPGPDGHGIVFTSGVDESVSLTGNPDAANNDVIGGVYFYAGSTDTAGFYFHGADNNSVYGAQAIPSGGAGGHSIHFEPWSGDPRFPLENVFHNIGMNQPVGGTSGTFGNIFATFQEGDGAPFPDLPYITALSHMGVQSSYGKRLLRTRELQHVGLDTATSVTGSSYLDVPGLAAQLTDLRPGSSRVRVTATGVASTAGLANADLCVFVDGAAVDATRQSVPSGGAEANVGVTTVVDPTTTTVDVSVRGRSGDGSTVTLHSCSLTVEELY